MQQRGLERRGREDLQVAPTHLRVRILAGDHLALLGDADRALHGAAGLGEDGLVARAAAATDRPAAAMKQAQPDAKTLEDVDQRHLRLVELPTRRQKAAILV